MGVLEVNRHDRKAWKAARTLDDLGELVIRWLNGKITETPDHMGPPEAETIPLIDALTVINRGGFITVMSQLADEDDDGVCNAWVDGFATDAVLRHLKVAVYGTPLTLTVCRRGVHDHKRNGHWWESRCQWRMVTGYWAERCPAAADAIRECWLVSVEDPEPGRNDVLWGVLTHALIREPNPRRFT
jgi:hypothetical protein